jgi:hypothetical protein
MFAQGEETVYPTRPQLGKFCLFNRDLIDYGGCGKVRGWTPAGACVMIRLGNGEAF